ncbi:MAG TPA: hypothetical protein VKP58_06360 [Candidatus Acidoferrum sp.]|nr:hypothetical protein [Candidatus Acidoferrum sp.]
MRTVTVIARSIRCTGLLLLISAFAAGSARAQNNELTFSLGGIPGQSRTFQNSGGTAQISADRSFGINYGHRFLRAGIAALYGEVAFAALPNRSIASSNATAAQNYAALYVTPGLRLKLLPSSRLSPWVAVGGGYALYEESPRLLNGQTNTNKFLNRGVFDYGGGLDYRLFRFLGLRGEVRDFFSGNPNLNVALDSSTQHNVVASGGVILRF